MGEDIEEVALQVEPVERLCCLSSALPWGFVPNDGVENGDELLDGGGRVVIPPTWGRTLRSGRRSLSSRGCRPYCARRIAIESISYMLKYDE